MLYNPELNGFKYLLSDIFDLSDLDVPITAQRVAGFLLGDKEIEYAADLCSKDTSICLVANTSMLYVPLHHPDLIEKDGEMRFNNLSRDTVFYDVMYDINNKRIIPYIELPYLDLSYLHIESKFNVGDVVGYFTDQLDHSKRTIEVCTITAEYTIPKNKFSCHVMFGKKILQDKKLMQALSLNQVDYIKSHSDYMYLLCPQTLMYTLSNGENICLSSLRKANINK